MTLRKKYELPNAYQLQNFEFDIERLREEVDSLRNEFIDVYEEDSTLYDSTPQLATDVHDYFHQVNLTEFNDDKVQDISREEAKAFDEETAKLSQTEQMKRRRFPLDPRRNEFNYDKPTEMYKGTYMEEVANSFKAKSIRVRLAKLGPGKLLPAHMEYDPTYSTRILIPIFSNDRAFTVVWKRNIPTFYLFVPNGRAYFLNTGFRHGVINMGDTDRINLMISLSNQDDLAEIPENLEDIPSDNLIQFAARPIHSSD